MFNVDFNIQLLGANILRRVDILSCRKILGNFSLRPLSFLWNSSVVYILSVLAAFA